MTSMQHMMLGAALGTAALPAVWIVAYALSYWSHA